MGRVTVKRLPPPGLSARDRVPLCFFTMLLARLRPSPTPPISRLRDLSARKKGSKICPLAESGTPMPVSDTVTATESPEVLAEISHPAFRHIVFDGVFYQVVKHPIE